MGEEKVQAHELTLMATKMMQLHDNEFSLAMAQKNRSVCP